MIVFIAGLVARLALIAANPVVFGVDTILRLANRDRIVVGHQLPVVATALHMLSSITLDVTAARCLMALGGALAGVGFYYLAAHFVNPAQALRAALLCATHPFLLALSTVPYEEPWMLAGLFFAFHFLLAGRPFAASLALGFACLTRFEAWAAVPVFILASRKDGRLKAAALFGWAPILWILIHRGLTPAGGFVLDTHITIWRVMRYPYVGWIAARFTPAVVLLLASAGVWRVWKTRQPRLWAPALFLLLFLIALFFSAHGVDPDRERYVSSREACIPIAAVLLLAAFGLKNRWGNTLVAIGVACGLYGGYSYLKHESDKPDQALSYRLARYLDAALAGGDRAVILVHPMNRDAYRPYLDKAYKAGGEPALAAARREIDARPEPIEFLRTVVHSHLPPGRLIAAPATEGVRIVAVWSTYMLTDPSLLQSFTLIETLREGPLSIAIFRRSHP